MAHKASDGTHLAGELHATHPGEAHDGGGRGVESGGGVRSVWRFSMLQVNDGRRDPDKQVSTCADWSGRSLGNNRIEAFAPALHD